ncbi:hypothetical protein L0P88_22005 [Muricauda sp. SCSIO 64092]|uniref:hypothetical protein n=1 Tax=Allomuricauda sp. SCSIO 64092 TaxID=2908842 RepID=UPI001FF64DC6|nr:hypothetical protein [Muricauda sp. SCSIO 64092]UOY06584.1 hypothetical protein L0P88_22005 [Muricauda sp. SCSIO 64092]
MKKITFIVTLIVTVTTVKAQWTDNGSNLTTTDIVGIGTASPNANLHIPNGNAIIGGVPSLNPTNLNGSLVVMSKDDNISTYPFYVGQPSGADIFWVRGNGNGFFKGLLGIGTASPNADLHIPNGNAIIGGVPSLNPTNLNSSLVVMSKDDNSSTYPFYVGQPSGADIFWVRGNGNGFFKGQVGIGTATTGSHKLAVEGSIGAREIKVEASGWSDFVFEKDYELRTLEEVEEHITEKGHLPEIPSEAEVTENGINLGEMNAKLLQKIEELTLYLIEQNKRMNQLEVKNAELEKEISTLKNE